MIIKVVFSDGVLKRLPDLTYERFCDEMSVSGGVASWEEYKKNNGMIELSDLNKETTREIMLVLEDVFTQRRIILKPVSDSEWEV